MEIIIHPQYVRMKPFIEQLPEQFSRTGEMLHDGRNKVKRFWIDNEPVIVKRYKKPNIIQRWVYTFSRPSKAERAYHYACTFRERGFDTPHEIAYIKINRSGLFLDSYFVSAETTDLPLLPLFKEKPLNRQAADELAEYLIRLHQQGILHGDLNLTNILYRVENGHYQFSLIDTNRSKFMENPSQAECIKNLMRLTHDKELLQYIITRYATNRAWDKKECLKQIMKELSLFEKKKQRKRQFRKLIGSK